MRNKLKRDKTPASISKTQITHKPWLVIGLVALILLFLGTGGFFSYQNYQLKKQITQIPIKFFPAVKAEFQKIKEKYNGKVSETNKLGIWWISPDGLNIINDDSSGVELNIFNCEADFKGITQLTGLQMDEIMKRNDFKTNQKNSSNSIEDDRFYDYIQAYENGAAKCVFVANPDCGTSSEETPMHYTFSFGCTKNLDGNYQQQAPYLKDLGINDAIIHVQKKIGDFVKLNVNFRRTGYYTIARLTSGKWNEIYSGQDIPSCEIVEKYKIPKEIISDCNPNKS